MNFAVFTAAKKVSLLEPKISTNILVCHETNSAVSRTAKNVFFAGTVQQWFGLKVDDTSGLNDINFAVFAADKNMFLLQLTLCENPSIKT